MQFTFAEFENFVRGYNTFGYKSGQRLGQWFVTTQIPDDADIVVSDIFYEPSNEKAKTMIRNRFVTDEPGDK